jgi:diguanylate cyclase (GGDEF)-like protein
LAWWQLAPLFGLSAVFVFHVEVHREAHTFSLSEMPLVLGLFFAAPQELILARLLGEAIVLIAYERQALTKLALNLSLFTTETCLALTIFHVLAGDRTTGPMAWSAAWCAVAAAGVLGTATVWLVIRWHGGHADARQLLLMTGLTATSNTSLAVVAAVLLTREPNALPPLLVLVALLIFAYRGYAQLTKRYAGLEMLFQFTRLTSGAKRPEQTIESVLDEARRLCRADYGAVILFSGEGAPSISLVRRAGGPLPSDPVLEHLPDYLHRNVIDRGETVAIPRTTKGMEQRATLEKLRIGDCLAAPLLSGGFVVGAILVGDRLGHVSTFDAEDARLFATLAFQASTALDNGRLIDQLHEQAQAREHDALHDALTGLPNRTLFSQHVDAALSAATETRTTIAVLLMDLDHFKEVNDTLGHHTGDQLLQEIARRVRAAIGDTGLAARLGGDEFAVLLPRLIDSSDALKIAEGICARIVAPVQVAAMSLEVGVSVGVALCPDHGHDVSTLLQRADVAMYASKRSHTHVTVYDPETDFNSEMRLRLAGELRAALESRELLVHYQPIARVSDGQVVKVEALARWRHPDLGLLPPDEFIPVAERTGQIEDLTLYVLDFALSQSREWRAAGLDIRVAVNLSVHVLLDAHWPAKVSHLLHQHEIPPDQLILEITETAIMSDPERMIPMLNKVAETGVIFSIDDFGTGYSSLSYLQRLPVSEVKIDKAFVSPMADDPAAANIVRSVIDLGHGLGLRIVAEGVEDQRTLDHLAAIDCDYAQGYYLSKPLVGPEITHWLRTRQTFARAARRQIIPAPR